MADPLLQAPEWFLGKVTKTAKSDAPDWFAEKLDQPTETEEADPDVVAMRQNRETEDFEEQLKDFIRTKEAGKWGYDAWVHRGTNRSPPNPPKPPTRMTLNEVLDWQKTVRSQGNDTAIGGYQIIHTTLLDAKRKLNLSGEEIFDEELQDRIASDYLLRAKRRVSVDDFLSGSASIEEFGNDLAREWAGLPVLAPTVRPTRKGNVKIEPGQSYYKGVGSNRALVDDLNEYKSIFELAVLQDDTEEEGVS